MKRMMLLSAAKLAEWLNNYVETFYLTRTMETGT